MLHVGEWPLVREHGFKVLVLIGDPHSLHCRRFYERHAIASRYSVRGQDVSLLRIDLAAFENDKHTAPYDADIRKHNRHDLSFRFHDLAALDQHLRSFVPPEAELAALGPADRRWLLLNHHNFLTSSPELLRAAHKLVLFATTEDLLFESYSTTATEGLEYYRRCVHPGVQVGIHASSFPPRVHQPSCGSNFTGYHRSTPPSSACRAAPLPSWPGCKASMSCSRSCWC
jgi:hypothetical protein